MNKLQLVIGDKHLSSWSMRPWLLMKHLGIPFEEKLIRLDRDTTRAEITKVSPSGYVPVLIDRDLRIWDSLAIVEYLAEKFPREKIWPEGTKERAWARSLCAEMHSGFSALRRECPMNLCLVRDRESELSVEAKRDLSRIENAWHLCRETHKAQGPYLFGTFTAADAYYFPIVARIKSYRLALKNQLAQEYEIYVTSQPLFRSWMDEAQRELV